MNKTEVTSGIRVQRKRQKGWRMPENTVYVGRGSRWGNPFRLVQYGDGKWSVKTDGSKECNKILVENGHAVYDTKEAATKDAIKCYSIWLLPYSHEGSLDDFLLCQSILEDAKRNLKGKNLACWCKIVDENGNYFMCHADLLLSLANNKSIDEIKEKNIAATRC